MRKFLLCFVVVALCASLGSGQVRRSRQEKLNPADVNQDTDSLVQAVFGCKRSNQQQSHDNFDWELIRKFSQTKDNTLVSPISVKIIMAIMYAAAGGDTKNQIAELFHFPNDTSLVTRQYKTIIDCLKTPPSSAYVLELGSRMYLDDSINVSQKFAATLKNAYNTEILKLDVTKPEDTVKDANNWVKQATKGNIDRLLFKDDLTDVVLLLLSTIYFNGTWANQFETKATETKKFYISGGRSVDVPFMNNMDRFNILVSSDLEAKILKLPFVGDGLSMTILLPNTINGLPKLLEKLTSSDIREYTMLMRNVNVRVSLPKFKYEFESQLVPIMKQLGITLLFENTASLPGIARGSSIENKLAVNNILQKAGIEVNELGTSAYAATAVTLVNKFGDGDEPPEEFIADKPFLFYIEDEGTKQILFSGTMNNPTRTNGKLHLPQVKCAPNEYLGDCKAPCDLSCDNLGAECPAINGECHQTCHCKDGFVRDSSHLCILITKCPSLLTVADIPSTTALPQPPGNFLTPQHLNPSTVPKKSPRFNYFDLLLLKNAAQEYKGNFMISPASIKAILGMLLEAADGNTAAELRSALRLSTNLNESRKVFNDFLKSLMVRTEGVELESANRIFLNRNLTPNPTYQSSLKSFYHSTIHQVDFAQPELTANQINNWVSKSTHGKIANIVNRDDFQRNTIMLLANTLYFKGVWELAFDETETEISCFKVNGRHCQDVAMMKKQAEYNYGFIEALNSQAIEMPYKDGKYSMLIFLPKEVNGVDALADDLAHNNLPQILKEMDAADVQLSMPKFTIEFANDLVSILQKAGIKEVFSPNANLSNIVTDSTQSPQVDRVIHKTHIEVNEQGSVAAAVTGAMVIPLMGTTTETMNIDHPFLFLIRDTTTESIIFGGRVDEPDVKYNRNVPNANQQNPQHIFNNQNIGNAPNTATSKVDSPVVRPVNNDRDFVESAQVPSRKQQQTTSSSPGNGNTPYNQEGKQSHTDEDSNHPRPPYKSPYQAG